MFSIVRCHAGVGQQLRGVARIHHPAAVLVVGREQTDDLFAAAEDRHLHIRVAARHLLLGLEHARVLPGVIDDDRLAAADDIGLDRLALDRYRLGVGGSHKLGRLVGVVGAERCADYLQRGAFEHIQRRALEAEILAHRARDGIEDLRQRQDRLEAVRHSVQRRQLAQVIFKLGHLLVQRVRHGIEGDHQVADLVVAGLRHAVLQVAGGHALRAALQL